MLVTTQSSEKGWKETSSIHWGEIGTGREREKEPWQKVEYKRRWSDHRAFSNSSSLEWWSSRPFDEADTNDGDPCDIGMSIFDCIQWERKTDDEDEVND